jgi:hypothetical protein
MRKPLPLQTEPETSPLFARYQTPYSNWNSSIWDRLTLLSLYLYTQH